ncbi:hypothetical protein SAMN05428989_4133 [Pseudoxanthomonas sp. GM95]|uniref:hypothetical protein n=1 Tax=Pseudoxanthomonas sp. GM95 TaxID=1881043 RepID=UPI0008AAC607|nr:hypothetical protein [Pseudoxanthomonas sp. GM95]SEM59799.1 hypothetical protein SAMN05428989_4133 [Pseudoxanthomonas sp. GM95]
MRPQTIGLMLLLGGCARVDQAREPRAPADAADLHVLLAACHRGELGDALCEHVEQAELQRMMSGASGTDEYRRLEQLPPIPASFDAPVEARP